MGRLSAGQVREIAEREAIAPDGGVARPSTTGPRLYWPGEIIERRAARHQEEIRAQSKAAITNATTSPCTAIVIEGPDVDAASARPRAMGGRLGSLFVRASESRSCAVRRVQLLSV